MALGKVTTVATLVSVSIAGTVAMIRLRAPGKPVHEAKVPATSINLKKVRWFDEWIENAPDEVKNYLD